MITTSCSPLSVKCACGWQYSRLQVGLRSLALDGAEHDILVWVPVQVWRESTGGCLLGTVIAGPTACTPGGVADRLAMKWRLELQRLHTPSYSSTRPALAGCMSLTPIMRAATAEAAAAGAAAMLQEGLLGCHGAVPAPGR